MIFTMRAGLLLSLSAVIALAEEPVVSGPAAVALEAAVNPAALVEELAADAGQRAAANFAWTNFHSTAAHWVNTGIVVQPGDAVTLFTAGTLDLGLGHALQPRHVLWYRIGANGRPENVASNNASFVADEPGSLFLTLRPFGFYWVDARGTYPEAVRAAAPVPADIDVVSVRWRENVRSGVGLLGARGHTEAAIAVSELAQVKTLPPHFDYLSILNRSNVFEAWHDGERRGIRATTADDAGIVKIPLDIRLRRDTEIVFDWRYTDLPAAGAETEAGFHDYLSIAVEFDNGQDLTWFWSTSLEPGSSFTCPLPWWNERETHIVLQSGEEGLGAWYRHRRGVRADYRKAVGGEAPKRIVGVWFIVNSLFGRQPAQAYFANVVISSAGEETAVFAGSAD
jgi:hypothetical protein